MAHPTDTTGGAARALRIGRIVLALVGLAALYLAALGRVPLLEPDEGRYTEIPREMLATGDFVVPHLDGVLYFEKPPLHYWLNAASIAAFGLDEAASRLPSALLALFGLGFAFLLGRSAGGTRVGVTATAILATSPLYLAFAHASSIDMTVTFFLGATLTCFWLAQAREPGAGERLLWYGMFAAAALAVLSKGLIGLVIPGGAAGLYLLLSRRLRLLARVPWIGGTLLALAIAAPWHLAVGARHPDFYWFYFIHEHFLRYATDSAARWQPPWFFLPVLAVGLLPWSGLLAGAGTLFRAEGPRGAARRDTALFLACWAGFVFVFFSASHSKLVPYILPAFLPLSVLGALAFDAAAAGEARAARRLRWGMVPAAVLMALLAGLFAWGGLGRLPALLPKGFASPAVVALGLSTTVAALGSAALFLRRRPPRLGFAAALASAVLFFACVWTAAPPVAAARSTVGLAACLGDRLAQGDEVVAFGTYPQTLPVYLRRTIPVVGYRGELRFGIAHLAPEERRERFPTAAELKDRWDSPKTLYLVTDERSLGRMQKEGLTPGPILCREGDLLLMKNG